MRWNTEMTVVTCVVLLGLAVAVWLVRRDEALKKRRAEPVRVPEGCEELGLIVRLALEGIGRRRQCLRRGYFRKQMKNRVGDALDSEAARFYTMDRVTRCWRRKC